MGRVAAALREPPWQTSEIMKMIRIDFPAIRHALGLYALLALIPTVQAQEDAAPNPELKIAVVDVVRVLEQSPQARAAREQLEKEFSPGEQELQTRQGGLRTLEEKLRKEEAVLSDTELSELRLGILRQRREFKSLGDKLRDELTFRRNEEFARIQKVIIRVIRDEAKSGEYDLVLGEGYLYAAPRIDITDQVIERLKNLEPN